ncbi:helix-turn-helix domain-containing protein [Patescibacteria group bacterium]|nr:helix-turn-helix domain-containing protein [Patescibacteria group bacterium]
MIKAGEKLKEKRLEKDLSLEEVSKSTKIKADFLEYIENSEYSKLPSVSYAHGFVRNYAEFLGLNEKEIMAIFRREFDEDQAYKVLPKGFEKTEEFSVSKYKIGRTAFFIFIIFAVFLGYILFQYRYAFINPPLRVDSPKENSKISASYIKVIGKTDSNATIYVNKDAVSVEESGSFEKTINVFPGKTTITVKAVNKFMRQTEKKIEVTVE